MPSKPAPNVFLMPKLQAIIAQQLASGRYRSATEVLCDALRLLDQQRSSSPGIMNGASQASDPIRLDHADELATILEGIGEGFYAVDHEWRITLFNSGSARHFGYSRQEVLGRVLWDVFPEAYDTGLGRQFREAMSTRLPVKSETASVVVPGRWLEFRLFPLGTGMGVFFRDVTDRRNAEEHRDLLMKELNHRVKNTIAMVQAIATQTLRNAGVEPGVQESLAARLITLGSVHDLLVNENWHSAEMSEVVRATLGPLYAPGRGPFNVDGPSIRLRARSAVVLSMALHELCTNAVKYGALSDHRGTVTVEWSVADDRFHLRWQEYGGPQVSPPGRKGFGSRLIERGLAMELQGKATIEYDAAGLRCTLEAPMAGVRDPDRYLETRQ